MSARLGHVGINVSNDGESFDFWKGLLGHLGFTIVEDGNHFDAHDGRSYLCVTTTKEPHGGDGFHRRRTGLNHVAISVRSPAEVDEVVTGFFQPRGIPLLYGGARLFPEYSEHYYAVYVEDPDRIKVEVVCERAS